ncbi:MAG: Outer rane lipoprotein carrier protein LolA [Proteobacteria bacterium]|nr:Outer rane lipoprotein carrier protein LolA [Pseudomonadota bacterium]
MLNPIARASVALAALVLVAAPARSQPAEAAAERVDRYLSRLATLRAGFQQEVLDASGAVREEAAGSLAVSKPGRFRWDYRTPSEQVLVSDGKTIWLYDVELEQVTVRKADQALSATPASLLSGKGKASESFVVADGGHADGYEWALLTPRLEDTDFRQVRLGFRDGALERMDLVDRLGQTTRIRFTDVELNPALADNLFGFKPPPGVDVVGSAGSP